MRFKDLKIRTKIFWAFGLLIAIAFALSLNSIYVMLNFRKDVQTVTDEFLPQLELSSEISNQSMQVAYHMEGFFQTGQGSFYQDARADLELLKQYISRGEELLYNSTKLQELELSLSQIKMELPRYEQVILMAYKTNQDMIILRSGLEVSAESFNAACLHYLESQNNLLRQEIRTGGLSDARRRKIHLISGIYVSGLEVQNYQFRALAMHNPSLLDSTKTLFPEMEEAVAELKTITYRDDDKERLERIARELGDYQEKLIRLGEKLAEMKGYSLQDREISGKVIASATQLRESALRYTSATTGGFAKQIFNSMIRHVVVVVLALVFALLAAVFMARSITHPLLEGMTFARHMTDGDLTYEMSIEQNDEIGNLFSNLKNMGHKLRQIISGVARASENIASASLELSATSQMVSQGASEQASSAEEVSSSIEEMAANIQQNTVNARETEQIARKAEADIYEGQKKVEITLEAMRELAGKISIIGDIAFQTNILALNAAVEAARAGEHGRGFGVVAAEVGKLAERSKAAAGEIDTLTRSSVFNAEEANRLMKQIVPDIQKTSRLVQEISAASQEQSAGADQINSAIQQLNLVTQQNAATAEELATNAEELSAQAQHLQQTISFFKMVEGDHTSALPGSDPLTGERKVLPRRMTHPAGKGGVFIDLSQKDELDEDFERF